MKCFQETQAPVLICTTDISRCDQWNCAVDPVPIVTIEWTIPQWQSHLWLELAMGVLSTVG